MPPVTRKQTLNRKISGDFAIETAKAILAGRYVQIPPEVRPAAASAVLMEASTLPPREPAR